MQTPAGDERGFAGGGGGIAVPPTGFTGVFGIRSVFRKLFECHFSCTLSVSLDGVDDLYFS